MRSRFRSELTGNANKERTMEWTNLFPSATCRGVQEYRFRFPRHRHRPEKGLRLDEGCPLLKGVREPLADVNADSLRLPPSRSTVHNHLFPPPLLPCTCSPYCHIIVQTCLAPHPAPLVTPTFSCTYTHESPQLVARLTRYINRIF
jgi:hypothetical protein